MTKGALGPGSIPLAELHGREGYRAKVDPDGFYAEAELPERYRGDFPPHASGADRQRLDREIARLRARQARGDRAHGARAGRRAGPGSPDRWLARADPGHSPGPLHSFETVPATRLPDLRRIV